MKTIEEINKELAERAGLAEGGYDDEGNQLFIGTDYEWQNYQKFQEQEENDAMERPEIFKN
jgi:hypothetical protein